MRMTSQQERAFSWVRIGWCDREHCKYDPPTLLTGTEAMACYRFGWELFSAYQADRMLDADLSKERFTS